MVEYFCRRCGKRCSKNPQFVGDYVYGQVCATKIVKIQNNLNLDDERIW